ncbi:MAG: holo-ACP synthase [Oscillospiraceae bacterium]
MLTTGIDLLQISRVKESMKNPRFLARIFSDEERAFFRERKEAPETVAANFAAKEAFSKALGTGIRGFALSEVSVLRDSLGAPYFRFSGQAEKLVAARNLYFSVSLTHTAEMAAAFVVAYPNPSPQSE